MSMGGEWITPKQTWKKETTIKRLSLNFGYKMIPQHAMKSRSLIKLKITLKLNTSEDTSSQEKYGDFIQHLQIPRLSDEDGDSFEGPVTYEECQKCSTLFRMANHQEKTDLLSNFRNYSMIY